MSICDRMCGIFLFFKRVCVKYKFGNILLKLINNKDRRLWYITRYITQVILGKPVAPPGPVAPTGPSPRIYRGPGT